MTGSSLYVPPTDSHKGQNGRLLVIGGSRQYHGAPIFSLLAARRFVDLLYFFPGDDDEYLLHAVSSIPEVIRLKTIETLPEIDCVLFGIGLGEVKFDSEKLEATRKVKQTKENRDMKVTGRKLVIDGDGLKLAKKRIPEGAILTPHENEFQMLFDREGTKENVKKMAKENNCIILKKGRQDYISDGSQLHVNKTGNEGMTKGGTGDVLSGLVAALACKNDGFEAAVAGAHINGFAGDMLFKKFGVNFCASDVVEMLPMAFRKFVES